MVPHTKRLIIIILGLFLLYSLSRMLFDYRKKLVFYEQYKKDYETEKDRDKKLKSEMIKAQDYNSVERAIREKLNLSKPGEIVVLVPKTTPTPTPEPTPIEATYRQWIKLFAD